MMYEHDHQFGEMNMTNPESQFFYVVYTKSVINHFLKKWSETCSK